MPYYFIQHILGCRDPRYILYIPIHAVFFYLRAEQNSRLDNAEIEGMGANPLLILVTTIRSRLQQNIPIIQRNIQLPPLTHSTPNSRTRLPE
jgi:hypothetical protein